MMGTNTLRYLQVSLRINAISLPFNITHTDSQDEAPIMSIHTSSKWATLEHL